MIHGLPLIHCLSDDAKAKMLGKITDRDCLPACHWEPWLTPEQQLNLSYFEDYKALKVTPLPLRDLQEAREYYDKFMREKPDRPKRVL